MRLVQTSVLIAVALVLLFLSVLQSLDFHWLGVRLDRHLVVFFLEEDGAAAQAGIRLGDRIIQVAGQDVYTRNHWMFLRRGFKAGESYTLTVRRSDGAVAQYVVVGEPDESIGTVLILPLVGSAFLFIGSLVYFLRFSDPASCIFFLATLAFALSYGMGYARNPYLGLLENAGFFAASLIVHFFLLFPVRRKWASRLGARLLLYLPACLSLVLSILMTVGVLRIDLFYTRSFIVFYQVVGGALGLGMLVYTASVTQSAAIRQQVKWIIWGGGIAVLANGVYAISNQVESLHELININLINWITLIVPVSFAFSIIRYRLFDIDTVINRSIVYVILVTAVLAAYFVVVGLLGAWNIGVDYSRPAVVAILLILLSVLFEPLRHQVQRVVDRVMYRNRPDYRQAMGDMGRAIVSSIDLEQVLGLVLDHLYRVTKSERIQVFLYQSQGNEYRRAALLGVSDRQDVLDVDHPLIQQLQSRGQMLCMPEDQDLPQSEQRFSAAELFMHHESLILCIALRSRERLLGWIGFGVQGNGKLYSLDERRFLATLADQAAVAIQNALLYQESQERARQLAVLHHIDKVLTSTLDLEELLGRFLAELDHIFAIETASVLLFDLERQNLVFRAAVGSGDKVLPGVRVLIDSPSIAATVAKSGEPILTNRVQDDPRWYSDIDRLTLFTTEQLICVPIVQRESIIGVIQVLNRRDRTPFTAADLNLLTLLAVQAAMAIENAQLYASTDRALTERIDELSMMQKIDRQLNATLDFDQVMSLTLDWAVMGTRTDAGFIGLIVGEGEERDISIAASQGYSMSVERQQRVVWPALRVVLSRVAAQAQVIDSRDALWRQVQDAGRDSTRSMLIVPVVREGRVIGVINLESDQANKFSDHDLSFIVRLADHAAIAIENAYLYRQVKLAIESKNEFVSLVSHELKAPMTIIKGYSELLGIVLSDVLETEQHRLLAAIIANVERMQNLINELLQLARLESGRIGLNFYAVSIHTILAEVMTSFRQMIDERELDVVIRAPSDLPPVYADPVRLNQIVTNLVSNAIKYTPPGQSIEISASLGPARHLSAPCDPPTRVVRCEVRDSGIGISAQDQDKLFTRFFRANHPHVRAQPGTGLGLSITRMLIKLHQGEIGVESELGRGSTFWFTVPVAEQEN